MLKFVGSYEAKTHLPQLLDCVAKGQKIIITRRGKPAAMLVPLELEKKNVGQLVKDMLAYRDSQGPRLGRGVKIRDLIDEGRRF